MANAKDESEGHSQPSNDQARSLDARLRQLELEVAERRKYEKVVNLLGAAAIAAGVLLGVFGIQTFSDIDDKLEAMVDRAITTHLVEAKSTLKETKKTREEIVSEVKQLERAKEIWNEIRPTFEQLNNYNPDTDLVGIWRNFLGKYQNLGDSEKAQWLLDPENRAKATNVVLEATKHIEQISAADNMATQFTPNDIFNIAQVSRALGRADLRRKLVDAAFEAEESAATQALHLESRAAANDESFEELVNLVENIQIDNPQIVVAEAWNAAEDRRDYSRLIVAIDRLIERHRDDDSVFLPSYVIAVKARAHLRRGLPQDLDDAVVAYAMAVRRLQLETPRSQWMEDTLQAVLDDVPELLSFSADMADLDEAISSSGIVLLEKRHDLLRSAYAGLRDSQR